MAIEDQRGLFSMKVILMRRTYLLAVVILGIFTHISNAQFDTLIDNGPSNNRVDIVFLGDGYTALDLFQGHYESHVNGYLDYMFHSESVLTDPFSRYHQFFNAHAIEVASNESGADIPSQGTLVDTALDATYETSGIARLLTINSGKANALRDTALLGTGITADMQLVTVNHTKHGGSGGSWATYPGGNASAREIPLHEIPHSFSGLADEYISSNSPYPGNEPTEINVTIDPTGSKWSHWQGFEDPRGSNLDIGVYEGGRYYQSGIYRPSPNSKMRSLGRAFDAVSREKIILDIYEHVDPLDDWLTNSSTLENTTLWVDVVDTEVIQVEWSVDGAVVAGATGETFNAADYGFGAGTYSVVARAYDEILDHVQDGSLLDLVRRDLDQLEQQLVWALVITSQDIPGDFNGSGFVDAADLGRWKAGFGRAVGATLQSGDADEDGDVDGNDFLVWQRNLGAGSPALVATIPEPTGFVLLAMGLTASFAIKRTKRKNQQLAARLKTRAIAR